MNCQKAIMLIQATLCWCALMALSARRSAGGQRPTSTDHRDLCDSIAWSQPRLVRGAEGEPMYVERPQLTAAWGDLALFGEPTLQWRSATIFADTARPLPVSPDSLAGVLIGSDGTAHLVRRPPHARRFLAPRVAFDGRMLHVVWGESSDTSARSGLYVSELWYARFDGRRWSAPELVIRASDIYWNGSGGSMSLWSGEPQIAVPANGSASGQDHVGVVYLRRDSTNWRISWIPTHGPLPSDVTVGALNDSAIVVSFLGGVLASGRPSVMNAIWSTRSVTGGATWSEPTVVSDLGRDRGYDLELVRTPVDLELFWLLAKPTETGGTVIARRRSYDSGQSWQQAGATVTDATVEGLRLVSRFSTVLAVGRKSDTDSLISITWPNSLPPVAATLPYEPARSLPGVAVVGDSLALVWGVDRMHAYPLFPSLPVPALLISWGSTKC